ncbi:MAG: CARDB domain-containing protein, partial [Desulfobacteraceae bacterium]
MKRLNPSMVDLMKLAALFLCMAYWSVGSLYAASDVSVLKDVGSNAAKPATLKKNNVRMGPSQLSTHGPAFPDLIIQSISISPRRPTTRDEVRLSVTVKNSGTAASRMCQLEIKIGGEARGHRFKVPVLAPKRTHT